jgi:hypothetical protein
MVPEWTRTQHFVNIEDLLDTIFYIGDPGVIMPCLTCSTLSVWLQLQTHLPDASADDTSIPMCSINAVLEGAM